MNYIVIDQGASSTKAFLFNYKGQIIHKNKINHILENPRKFYFQSHPISILKSIEILFWEMINQTIFQQKVQGYLYKDQHLCFGIKNKQPITPAISWQCSCASSFIKKTIKCSDKLWEITGTPLSPHFSMPKFLHFVKNNHFIEEFIADEKLFFGPLSAFLTHLITNNIGIDNSIACRTLLFNISKNK